MRTTAEEEEEEEEEMERERERERETTLPVLEGLTLFHHNFTTLSFFPLCLSLSLSLSLSRSLCLSLSLPSFLTACAHVSSLSPAGTGCLGRRCRSCTSI